MTKKQTRPQQAKAAPEKVEAAPVVEPKPVKAKPQPKPRKAKPEQVIASKYGVEPAQVVKWRVEDGQVVALVDHGIKGLKKYKVPLTDFGKDAVSFQG